METSWNQQQTKTAKYLQNNYTLFFKKNNKNEEFPLFFKVGTLTNTNTLININGTNARLTMQGSPSVSKNTFRDTGSGVRVLNGTAIYIHSSCTATYVRDGMLMP